MNFLAEHIFIGQLGKATLLISLLASCIAAVLYFSAQQKRKMMLAASGAFLLHLFMVLTAAVALMMMIFNHYFEYHYVWQYSSVDTSNTYLLAAFWAGKEGSMLLWLLLQALLGTVMMFRRNTPAPVMGVIAVANVLLNLLLIGISVGGLQLGSSPFDLLREIPEYADMPLFSSPAYLSFLIDGNGLNPLLRNPWMAIHPPVLFLGYAACLIPYAFSINAVLKKEVRPAMPLFWLVFAAFCLGAGLILGGAWAYEDLTFGGFWSWDPVENASLVPWILTIAALHFLLAPGSRSTGVSFSSTPYIAVLLAAYLTRSGVLSTTSVHSFAGGQGSALLLAITLIAVILPLLVVVFRKKPTVVSQSENLRSSGLWMFIGAAVLVLAAFQVLFVTMLPAFNAWFGSELAPPSDPVAFFNKWQLWFVGAMGISMGVVLYLPTGPKFNASAFIVRLLPALIVSCLLTLTLIFVMPGLPWLRHLILFCLFFAGFAMLDGLLRINKRSSNIAASLTHFGFALFIIGAIITFSLERPLGVSDAKNPKGLQTLIKGQIKPMQQGYVSYAGSVVDKDEVTYQIDFLSKGIDGNFYLDYSLYPTITVEENMGPVAKPDTRKTLKQDIFVHLTHAEITLDEYEPLVSGKIVEGDTLRSTAGLIILDSLTESMQQESGPQNLSATAWCRYTTGGNPILPMNASIHLDRGAETHNDAINDSTGLKLRLVYPVTRDTAMLELSARKTDYVVLSARSFPYINILWLGVIIMALGMGISVVKRARK